MTSDFAAKWAQATPVAAAYTLADIRYDPETHTSTLPDGRDVPHVTAILGAVGVAEDFEKLAGSSARLADSIDLARDRGRAVHADCHAFDDDDLDLRQVDQRVLPYVEAWIRLRADKQLRPVHRERRIFHPTHCYSGILDGVFLTRHDRRILIDIKTGDPESAAAHLQTAAYEAAYVVDHPDEPIDSRWAVWLTPGYAVPYRITNYSHRPDAWQDFQVFLACLCVYRNQLPRRREAAGRRSA